MISINKRLAMFICLAGVMLLVVCRAAEIPKKHDDGSSSDKHRQVSESQGPKQDENDQEEDNYEDDEDEDEDYDENEDEDYEEDESEEEEAGSPEEELSWLAEQHYIVKQDCADLNQTIAESKNSTDMDPELEQAYEQCTNDLDDIESRMQVLVSEITED
jgi:hypothetical protein